MNVANLVVVLVVMSLEGCNLSGNGFRFSGQYRATRSGYCIYVISKGYVKPGDDLAESAFAVAAFCLTGNSDSRPVLVTLAANPRQWIKLDCEELGIAGADMNWKTSRELLTTLLSKAGYSNLAPEEVQASARVIMNSLSGPKGVILKGQIESLQVLHTDITYGYNVNKSNPPGTWIDVSEFPGCN